jgi:hypothetical protein
MTAETSETFILSGFMMCCASAAFIINARNA